MSNNNTTKIGRDVKGSTVISGDGNTVNNYYQTTLPSPPPSEIPTKADYDRLPIPSSDLIGRSKELELLDNAFNDPKKYVVSIIAGGGVGKSALTYAWLDKLKPDYGGAKMIFGWSFYSQGSHDTQNSSAPFFQEAFRFFGYTEEFPKDEVEKGKELAKCLRNKPSVLILDGMEPLQHPVKILNGEIRDTALKELLRCVRLYGLAEKSLVVISSRQPIVEYEQWKQGYEKIDLNVLNDVQGAILLDKLGVKSISPEELHNASRDMGGHALSLVLLGRLLVERFGGDVRRRDRLPNLFEELKDGGHALRILQYYDREYWQEPEFFKRFWSRITGKIAPEQIFMRLLGLFDRPMGLKEKQVLCEKADFATPLAALNDDENKALEKRLENAGLMLKADKFGIRTEWDCHPLIRSYFGQIFRKEDEKGFQQAHSVLFEYYQSVPKKHQPDTLEELEPLYRAVVHGCLAGEYEKALFMYYERIDRGNKEYGTTKLGAYAQALTAISAFFPDGWEKPVSKGLPEVNQGWLLAESSFCLMSLGRLAEAVEPRIVATKIAEKLEDWKNAANSAECLTELYLSIGSLKDAENAAQQGIAYADRADNRFHQLINSTKFSTTLHRQGYLQKSLVYFEQAEKIQKELFSPFVSQLNSLQGFQYYTLLSDKSADIIERKFVLDRGHNALKVESGLLDVALGHLTIARALFALNRFDEASAEFDEAVRGIRKAGKVQYMPEFLLASAKFLRHQKQFSKAWHDLEEAKEIIERCGMKLYAVDANLLEGNLSLDRNDANNAMNCHKEAKRLIEYTGYHLRDAELELLAARLAHFERDAEKTKHYLNKSYNCIEKIGYWGFLAEWEKVKNEIQHYS